MCSNLCLAAEEVMTPSGSGSTRVYTQMTGVGPMSPMQTPSMHHPLMSVHPQCEFSTVLPRSISVCHVYDALTLLFQFTVRGNNPLDRCPWGGAMITFGMQCERSLLLPVSNILFFCRVCSTSRPVNHAGII